MRHVNPSGFVYYDNEAELCKELELFYFSSFFDNDYGEWEVTEFITKEVWLNSKKRIDYFGYKGDKPAYVEVKNWFITTKDIKQILCYNKLIEKKYPSWGKFYVICGGVDEDKLIELIKMSRFANVILTKDIKEINPKELIHWM